jgi:hypothetical protein
LPRCAIHQTRIRRRPLGQRSRMTPELD